MKKVLLTVILTAISLTSLAQQWTPVGAKIRTQWADDVDPSCPLPEYPRPQMVRSGWMNLNGLWDYAVTSADTSGFSSEGKILVPFPLESSLSGVGKRITKENALWYQRTFTVPRSWKGKNVLLHFGAVDWKAEVFVNGVAVGIHTGGYDPFSFDITSCLKPSGTQTLVVKVQDATDNSFQPRGKQCVVSTSIWYTPVSGIWQTVWLEPVSRTHIRNYYAVSDISKGELSVDVDVENLALGDKVKVSLVEGGVGYSAERPSSDVIADAFVDNGTAVLKIDSPTLWSPDSPYLYGLKVSVHRNGKAIDSVEGYTALREIGMQVEKNKRGYKRMTLNGEYLFHFGLLDQGWWPDGLYTSPTDEALKFDIVKTKEMGYNMIRKHVKVEPARWYYYCDALGMMVWQDMPNMGDRSKKQMASRDPEIQAVLDNECSYKSIIGGSVCEKMPAMAKSNFYSEWERIICALKGFQCIVMWVPFNEAWGQFDTENVVAFTRELDPTRIVNEASGGTYALCGDVVDVHTYPYPGMDFFEKKFVNVIGEYGGIGYPVKEHMWSERKWGYGNDKHSTEELMEQYEIYAELLKTFISVGCAGAVYTQTTDVESEINGLITYDRKVMKADVSKMKIINKEVIRTMTKTMMK